MSTTVTLWIITLISIFTSVFWINVYLTAGRTKTRKPDTWPSVSVIVPAFNEEDNIKECVQSLLNLDYPKSKYEILVVDDGSKDNTYEVAKSMESDQVKVFTQENQGKAGALNTGITKANGEFVACMDADSITTEPVLKQTISAFVEEDIASVTTGMKVHKPETLLQKLQMVEYFMGIWLRKLMSDIDVVQVTPGPFSVYRKNVMKEVGGFEVGNITEDNEIAMKLHYNGYKIKNMPEARTYTIGPPDMKGLYYQRMRWYKGLFRNSVKYRDMFFKKEYGNFGKWYLPFMWMTILTIMVNIFLFGWTMFNYATQVIGGIGLVGIDYIIPSLEGFSMASFLLGRNAMVIFPVLIVVAIGIQVIRYSFIESNEKMKSNIFITMTYVIVYFLLLGVFWVLSLFEELFRIDRDW